MDVSPFAMRLLRESLGGTAQKATTAFRPWSKKLGKCVERPAPAEFDGRGPRLGRANVWVETRRSSGRAAEHPVLEEHAVGCRARGPAVEGAPFAVPAEGAALGRDRLELDEVGVDVGI